MLRAQGKKILEMCDKRSLDDFTIYSGGDHQNKENLTRENEKLER
jgi:hypothetical protein